MPVTEVHDWEDRFLQFVRDQKSALYKKLDESKKLDDATIAEIEAAIAEFQRCMPPKRSRLATK